MISFKYKNTTKKIQMSQKIAEDKLITWFNQVFMFKGNILGFKTQTGKYIDLQYFCKYKSKFYGQLLEIIEASDQMQISFTSDNLSTSVQPSRSPLLKSINSELINANSELSNLGYIHDIKNFDKLILVEGNSLSLIFVIEDQASKANIINKFNQISNKYLDITVFYHVLSNKKDFKFHVSVPLYLLYIGKKKIIEMSLAKNFQQQIQSIITKYRIQYPVQETLEKTIQKLNNEQEEDDCPSFLTNNILERISKEAVFEYLEQMSNQFLITDHQLNKFHNLINENFNNFCRLYCPNLFDTDYESFRNIILAQLAKYRVDEFSILGDQIDNLQRPISRQQQRKSNLKKSVSNIEIVKIQNYLEILEKLTDLMLEQDVVIVKRAIIQQNEQVFEYFADFLARKYDKQALANYLVIFSSNSKQISRPVSRCLPRHTAYGNINEKNQKQQVKFIEKQESIKIKEQQFKIVNAQQSTKKPEEIPQFGQSKKSSNIQLLINNFSPLKYLQNIDNSYRNAEKFLLKKINQFSAEEYGLLFHLLKAHDDSISNLIQQLQFDQEDANALSKLKNLLNEKINEILSNEFHDDDVRYFKEQKNKKGTNIYMIFQNFRYESNLNLFLSELKKEKKHEKSKTLHKKSSVPQILNTETLSVKAITNRSRKPSDQQDSFQSESSNRRQQQFKIEILDMFYQQNYWEKEFKEMLNCVPFSDKSSDQLTKSYEDNCASVYTVIRSYNILQQNNASFDKKQMKKYFKKDQKPSECKRLLKYNIWKYLLRILVDQKKINDDKLRFYMLAFIEENISIISALQTYFVSKDQKQLLENLELIFFMQQLKIEQTELETFMNRLLFFLNKIYEHPNMLTYTVKNYSYIFKSICQLYHLNADNNDFFENLDLLNSYSFEVRFMNNLNESKLKIQQKYEMLKLWKSQQSSLIEGVIQVLQENKDFGFFIEKYAESLKINSRQQKVPVIPQTYQQKKMFMKLKLQRLSTNTGNLDFLDLIKYFDESNMAFNSIWDCYQQNQNEQDLQENLQLFMRKNLSKNNSPQLQALLSSSPLLKKRYQQRSQPLLKIIKIFSDNQSNSHPEELQKKLQQYEEQQNPSFIQQTLRSLGVTKQDIDILLEAKRKETTQIVHQYLQSGNEQQIFSKINGILEQIVQKKIEQEESQFQLNPILQMYESNATNENLSEDVQQIKLSMNTENNKVILD